MWLADSFSYNLLLLPVSSHYANWIPDCPSSIPPIKVWLPGPKTVTVILTVVSNATIILPWYTDFFHGNYEKYTSRIPCNLSLSITSELPNGPKGNLTGHSLRRTNVWLAYELHREMRNLWAAMFVDSTGSIFQHWMLGVKFHVDHHPTPSITYVFPM